MDETKELVRYYLNDLALRTAPAALEAAAGRSLFGKKGYLGVPTSAEGLDAYKSIANGQIGWTSLLVGLSDEDTEGQWVIMAGPRQGQVLWDHSTTSYGPGAEGSGWTRKETIFGMYRAFPVRGIPATSRTYNYAKDAVLWWHLKILEIPNNYPLS